ncbi:MAG: glycosyltransferase [Oscillospiraceae bacterium]|nr:glycosyltransferase [Oscillospiraceae bacterium]
MRILSITAQKPDSTGSGVFLTELVKGFRELDCPQAVVCGTVAGEEVSFPEGVMVFPVCYQTEELPFPVCGMSDEMPYESTRYRDLDGKMTQQLRQAFCARIAEAVEDFLPDVILCHHLYFIASLVRQMYPRIPVYGQCHGSDLRQIETNPWQRQWIKEQIPKLDGIFALHEVQKERICQIFDLPAHRVRVMGTGYNSNVFFQNQSLARNPEKTRYLFAGKLSEKKGVYSLLRCLRYLKQPERSELYLAGGCGSEEELEKVHKMAETCPCPVTFLGKLDQAALAAQMNQCDVFVLPSFYEGLPLVLIEAMACGMRTVCTDLPGIQPWLAQALPDSGAIFVTPPAFRNADEPIPEELPAFEMRLAAAMEAAARTHLPDGEQVARLSWGALCRRLMTIMDHQEDISCW